MGRASSSKEGRKSSGGGSAVRSPVAAKGKTETSKPKKTTSSSSAHSPSPKTKRKDTSSSISPVKKSTDPNAPVTARLHLAGLNPEVSAADIRARFTTFGEVLALDGWPAGKNAVGDPTTYAYLTLETTHGKLAKCMSILNNAAWRGFRLRIAEARPNFSDRVAREIEQVQASGWKPPSREEVEGKLRLEQGGRMLSLDEVRRPPEAILSKGLRDTSATKRVMSPASGSDSASSSSSSSSASSSESGSVSDEDENSDDGGQETDQQAHDDEGQDTSKDPHLKDDQVALDHIQAKELLEDKADTSGEDAASPQANDQQDVAMDDTSQVQPTPTPAITNTARSRVQFSSLEQMFRVRADADDEDGEKDRVGVLGRKGLQLGLDEDDLEAVQRGDAAPTAAGGVSILGGLALDDVEMDEDFDFGKMDGGGAGPGAVVNEGGFQWDATRRPGDDSHEPDMPGARRPRAYLFPRFEAADTKDASAGWKAVPDERNPAYQLLFLDSTPRSERVPPFRRTQTLDEIEEHWKATRHALTQEYKRRHREAVKKQRRRVVGSRVTGGVVGLKAPAGGARGEAYAK